VWATDSQGKDGKGQQVFKFNTDGKVLMTLGKAESPAMAQTLLIGRPPWPLPRMATSLSATGMAGIRTHDS